MDKRTRDERQYAKALTALATVSSLGVMTVFDFILAYWGGDWLDNYFQTGDHTFRMLGVCLAVVTLFLSFYRLIVTLMTDKDEE